MDYSYKPSATILNQRPEGYPSLIVAGGCFWCVESEFRRIPGVLFTRVGYAGGTDNNPTYEKVCMGRTGHLEVLEIIFDPKQTSYSDLVDFFMTRAHDPTQDNGQGPNIGSQYLSAILYSTTEEKIIIENLFQNYREKKTFRAPVATQVLPMTTFHEAEDYHQQYYEKYERKMGQKHINIQIKERKLRAGY